MATRKQLEDYLENAYRKNGIDPNIGKSIIEIESKWDPSAKNPNSSARGLMQFTDSTAKDYGIDQGNPYQSIDASIKYLKDAAKMGIDITDAGKAYLAWQQGQGGAKKLLKARQSAPIEDVIGKKQAQLNGMAGMTVAEGVKLWTDKARKIHSKYSGSPQQYMADNQGEIQDEPMIEMPQQATAYQTPQIEDPIDQQAQVIQTPAPQTMQTPDPQINPTESMDLGMFEQKPTRKQQQIEKMQKEEALARAFGIEPDMTGILDPDVDSALVKLFEES